MTLSKASAINTAVIVVLFSIVLVNAALVFYSLLFFK